MRKVKNNIFIYESFYLISSRISLAVSGVLFWWMAAKIYSVDAIGTGSALISLTSLLVFLSSLGFSPTVVRFLPQHRERAKIVGTLFVLSLFLLIMLSSAFLLSVRFISSREHIFNNYAFFFPFLFFTISMQIFGMLDGVYIALRSVRLILLKNIIQNFSRIGILFILISLGGFGIFSSNCLAAIFAIIVSFGLFIQEKASFKIEFKPDFSVLRKYLPFSLVNFLNTISFSLVGMIAPIVILFLYSKREAGLFYLPWMVFSTYCSFILSVNSVFLMRASYGEDVQNLFKKVLPFSFGLGLIGFLFFFFGGSYILSIFKRDFSLYSSGILRIFFSSIFFFIINQIYITLLNIRREIIKVGKVSIFIFLSIILFASLLMPDFEVAGIAYAWLFANLSGNIYIFLMQIRKSR